MGFYFEKPKKPARFGDAFSLAAHLYETNQKTGRGADLVNPGRVGLTRKQILWVADYHIKGGGRVGDFISKPGEPFKYQILNSYPPRDVLPEQRPYWAGEIKKLPADYEPKKHRSPGT